MSDSVIRISRARATFAAELLAGCRSSLLTITDLLDLEHEMAQSARRRSGDIGSPPDSTQTSKVVAAALYAGWIADALHRQVAFFFELDRRNAGIFDAPLPPTDVPPQAPPEWPQPALPAPLDDVSNPLTGLTDAPSPRTGIAARMQEIGVDLDEATRAIDYSQRVRFQAEISGAAARLRDWVSLSARALGDEG